MYTEFGSDLIDSIDFIDSTPFDAAAMNDAVDLLTIDEIPVGTIITWNNGASSFESTPGAQSLAVFDDTIGDLVLSLIHI